MINKKIDDITEDDLSMLVQNEITERRNFEYKAGLSLNTDKERIEFLADVSSLANTSGGDLYIGIVEDREKGIPKEVRGISIENSDQEILRIGNLIRDGISPHLAPPKIRCLKLTNGNYVILIRIALGS
jgi:predicted HTH transcriptional regulator